MGLANSLYNKKSKIDNTFTENKENSNTIIKTYKIRWFILLVICLMNISISINWYYFHYYFY